MELQNIDIIERKERFVNKKDDPYDQSNIKSPANDSSNAPPPSTDENDVATSARTKNFEMIAESINDYLKLTKTNLQVEIHEKTNKTIFIIVRSDDKKVIREVPPREMLEIEANIRDMVGMLVNKHA